MERIGIIGLGRMGRAMATRLAGQGAHVTGWTRSGLAEQDAKTMGIAVAQDLPALCAASDILVTSLFDDAAVDAVLSRLADLDMGGKLLVETSTVSPDIVERHATASGIAIIDAPISGGPEMVLDATCGLFIGGSDADVARAEPVLALMSGKRAHVGPLGAGMAMKAIVNAQLNVYFAGLRETLPLARAAGIPFETAITIVANSPAGMPMFKARLPRLLGTDTSVGFSAAGAQKDVAVFIDMVEALGQAAPALAAADAAWSALDGDLQRLDVATLVRQAYDRD